MLLFNSMDGISMSSGSAECESWLLSVGTGRLRLRCLFTFGFCAPTIATNRVSEALDEIAAVCWVFVPIPHVSKALKERASAVLCKLPQLI